jgi:eukaryotic-like serine/threonine-protein kinase
VIPTLQIECVMPAPDLKRVADLFDQAVSLPKAERSAFLAGACAGNAALLAAVEALLEHDSETETFLVSPVAGAAQRHREDPPTLLDLGHAAAPVSLALLPTLPGYEVLEELGRGGMGVVYKARQTRLNRLVAVKMLPPGGSLTSEQLARFRIEAETLARLKHPNIVTIYDVGEHQGQPYFVLEYVPGPSLAQVLARRSQDPFASARLIETVARAIHAVHACGIIHRDLKPANILLQRGEELAPRSAPPFPKVTDFGLAKDPSDRRKLTQTGAALGTPCYMAPEQAVNAGPAIGPATDVYALGSILYEMLVGRPPFEADSPFETVLRVLRVEPVSPASLRPSLPRDLATICLKCLEKSPQRRYASAEALADDLHRFQQGEPIRARPVSAAERAYRWCRRRPLVAGLLALVGVLAAAFVVTVLVYNARLEAALTQLKEQSDQQRRQIVHLNVHIGIALLDSGDAFAALLRFTEALRLDEDGPEAATHRGRIATILEHAPRLTELLDLEAPVIGANVTATGGLVATVGADNAVAVWQVPARRRIATGLAHPDAPVHAAFSADGRLLGTITASGTARIWDLATGNARIVATGQGPVVPHLAFHPSGRVLVTEYGNALARVWDLTTDEPTPMMRDAIQASVLAIPSSDGRWLFTADAENRGRIWNLASGQPTSPAFALVDAVHHVAVSSDGRRLAVEAPNHTVRVWDLESGRLIGKALTVPDDDEALTLSPDGRRLCACGASGACRLWDADTAQPYTPLLHSCGPLVCAGIDSRGDGLVTVGKNGIVCFWELGKHAAGALRSIAELVALAQVHAGGRLDEHDEYRPLSAAQLRAAWEVHRAR